MTFPHVVKSPRVSIPRFIRVAVVYIWWLLWLFFNRKKNHVAAEARIILPLHASNVREALVFSHLLDIEEEKIEHLLDRYAPFPKERK